MQNLVLAVQNNTRQADMGAASATVAFFRSMGGAVGVSALGAVLAHQVARLPRGRAREARRLRRPGPAAARSPTLASLPAPVRNLYETAFGEATGHIFLISVPFALVAFVCILFIREVPLRTTLDVEEDGRLGRPGAGRSREGVSSVGAAEPSVGGDARADAVHRLEQEVGVLLRRVRRAVGERARLVHPDLHPSAYFLLAHIDEHGPRARLRRGRGDGPRQGRDEPRRAAPHRPRAGRPHARTPPTAGPPCSSVSAEGRTRLADMAVHRRKRLDERLSGWSDDELTAFVSELARYNATLD